jgi:hypothetical protein
MSLEKHVVLCDCYCPEHQFIILKDQQDGEVWFEVHLYHHDKFIKRLWTGLKYAFGYKSRHGHFDSILVAPEDQAKIVELLKTNAQ